MSNRQDRIYHIFLAFNSYFEKKSIYFLFSCFWITEKTKYVTRYSLTGTTPNGYVLPLTKNYYQDAIVEVDSEYGAGSSFKLTVNQKIADATPVGDTEYLT